MGITDGYDTCTGHFVLTQKSKTCIVAQTAQSMDQLLVVTCPVYTRPLKLGSQSRLGLECVNGASEGPVPLHVDLLRRNTMLSYEEDYFCQCAVCGPGAVA